MGIMWGGVEVEETPENGSARKFDGTVRKYREDQPQFVLTDRIYNGEHTSKRTNVNMAEQEEQNADALVATLADATVTEDSAITPITVPVATGGVAPYTYAVSGLPAGLSFNTTSRVISGTPTTAGTSTVTLTVTDSTDVVDTDTGSFVVSPAGP